MRRTAPLVFLFAIAAGCGQKKNENPYADTGEVAGIPPVEKVTVVTDWVVVDDVAVGVQKVRVQKPVLEELDAKGVKGWTARELEAPELLVWVDVKNRGKTALDFKGWGWAASDKDKSPKLRDEHGKEYKWNPHEAPGVKLRGRPADRALESGDAPLADVLSFEKPDPAATKLTLLLPSLVTKGKAADGYKFEIPASAWK